MSLYPLEKRQYLVGCLLSDDFFGYHSYGEDEQEVHVNEENRLLKFEIVEVKESDLPEVTDMVTGNLTMKGITKSITFLATINQIESALTAKAQFSVNGHDWGINFLEGTEDIRTAAREQYIDSEIKLSLSFMASPAE